jgi:tetratricopeptide (TPR) repeat protein
MTALDRLRQALADRYAVERELGHGGMATVYLATDLKHQRQVAIKVLRPELAATVGPERFLREIEIAARLSHPHVLPLLDSGRWGDATASGGRVPELLFYVMPYVPGESLRERMTRGAVPLTEALRLLTEVADALAYAHEQGVVHRDIKPENIMIAGRHALVMDFGVARALSEAAGEHRMTSVGFALGTPAYMAPEQAAGDPNVDHRADLYALGIVAYELLTGRLPHEANTPQQLLAAHISKAPDPITQHRGDLPAGLAEIVMRCLEKSPTERWSSAESLREALERLGPSGASTPAAGLAPVPPLDPWHGHPIRVGALFALVGVVVLGAVFLLVRQLGLPDWVLTGAIGLLLLGFPVAIGTGLVERKRLQARGTGSWHQSGETGLQRVMTWRRMRHGGMAAFTGLGLAAAVYTAMRMLGIGPVGTLLAAGRLAEEDRIVVADFVSRSSDTTLGASVSEALRIDLGQSPVVRVLDATEVRNALERMGRPEAALDPATARELAVREGGKAILVGEVSPAGRGFLLTARLVAVADDIELVALRETADDDGEVLNAIDRLSKRLRERMGESLKAIRAAEPLEQVTTSSLEALRLYTQARAMSRSANPARAGELLLRAVALDSGFAMAWRGLGVHYFNTQAPRSKIVEAATNAFRHRDRLPQLERHLTEAYYYFAVTREDDLAERAYRAVLERRPDDIPSLNNLSLSYTRHRRWAGAESLLLRGLAVDSGNRSINVNLVEVLAKQGKVAEARASTERMVRLVPGTAQLGESYRWNLLAMDRQWDSVARLARDLEPRLSEPTQLEWAVSTQAVIAVLQGRIAEGERLLLRAGAVASSSPAERLRYATYLAELRAEYGTPPSQALRLMDAALARDPIANLPLTDRPYQDLINTYAMLGGAKQARQLLDAQLQADTLVRERPSSWQLTSRGWVLIAERKFAQGLALLRTAQDSAYCWACDAYYLARAYDQAGEPDSVLSLLERVVNRQPDWEQYYDDAGHYPRALKRLGELHEERGNRAKALDYYGRLTELWRDPDPALQPVVRDVKARMARLAGE